MRKFLICLGLTAALTAPWAKAIAATELPFTTVQNKPVVAACIQKVCGHFLVDFGAPGQPDVYLRKSLLKQLSGVESLHKTVTQSNVAGKTFRVRLLSTTDLRLAGETLPHLTVAAWRPWGVSSSGPRSRSIVDRIDTLDGVIGLAVFEHFSIVALDYAHHRFVLSRKSTKASARAERFHLDANGISVPVKINGHRYRMVVDTGANYSSLKRSRLQGDPQVRACPPPNKNCGILHVHSFSVDGLGTLNPMILVLDNKEPDYDGILGDNALRKVVLYLNFATKEFWVTRA